MTKGRARKQLIRARVSATGEPYSVAARAIEVGQVGYHRAEWWTSGWMRLLPYEAAASLEIAITTATVIDNGAPLDRCLARYDFRRDFPDGAATSLVWSSSGYDSESLALREADRQAFQNSLAILDLPIPETVGELAHILSKVGVYEVVGERAGSPVLSSPEILVPPGAALPLQASWVERDEEIRWRMITSKAVDSLRRGFLEKGYWGAQRTTLDRLTDTVGDRDVETVRDALDGLIYSRWGVVQRSGRLLDRQDVAALSEHAVFEIELFWDEMWDLDIGESVEGEIRRRDPLQGYRWSASPWSAVLEMSEREPDSDTLPLLGALPFRTVRPDAESGPWTTLQDMAQSGSASLLGVAMSFSELESHGLVSWDSDEQMARLHRPGDSTLPTALNRRSKPSGSSSRASR